jgi:hypothetical protein
MSERTADIANGRVADEELFTFESRSTGNEIPVRDVEDSDLEQNLVTNRQKLMQARGDVVEHLKRISQYERVVGVLEFELERRRKTLLVVPKLNG